MSTLGQSIDSNWRRKYVLIERQTTIEREREREREREGRMRERERKLERKSVGGITIY